MKITYIFFWDGMFSNWYESPFTVDGTTFNCGEQYMMYQKAITFNDADTADRILQARHPREHKALGREVKNFNSKKWDEVKYSLVKSGLREKFLQNEKLKAYLLKHKGCTMVEASPYDRIWGIGFNAGSAMENIDRWGENLLGKILTELANEIE
jgi:ribA/ribD-fused uncharacterized protein